MKYKIFFCDSDTNARKQIEKYKKAASFSSSRAWDFRGDTENIKLDPPLVASVIDDPDTWRIKFDKIKPSATWGQLPKDYACTVAYWCHMVVFLENGRIFDIDPYNPGWKERLNEFIYAGPIEELVFPDEDTFVI